MELDFYRHYQGKTCLLLGAATQVEWNETQVEWIGVICHNTEQDQSAELGISPSHGFVFRTLDKDWQMPGEWVAYFEPVGKEIWLRPRAIFFGQAEGGHDRFKKISA